MQRRTNSYGDNPLREEDLIKEYAEFKYLLERDPQDILKEKEPVQDFSQQAKLKGQLGDVQARLQSDKDLDAEFERLGLGKWYDVSSMWKSDDEERADKLKAIQDFYNTQQMGDLERGRAGEGDAEPVGVGAPKACPAHPVSAMDAAATAPISIPRRISHPSFISPRFDRTQQRGRGRRGRGCGAKPPSRTRPPPAAGAAARGRRSPRRTRRPRSAGSSRASIRARR